MTSIDAKELIKLAKICRKAGIKSLKTADYEFILSDDSPTTRKRNSRAKGASNTSDNSAYQTDSLSEQDLLFWSTGMAVDDQVPPTESSEN